MTSATDCPNRADRGRKSLAEDRPMRAGRQWCGPHTGPHHWSYAGAPRVLSALAEPRFSVTGAVLRATSRVMPLAALLALMSSSFLSNSALVSTHARLASMSSRTSSTLGTTMVGTSPGVPYAAAGMDPASYTALI